MTKLSKILKKHKLWLNDDKNGVRADLSNTNLSGANLTGAYLSYTNLSNADLSYADLSYADLSDANLSNADLSDADLSDANLSNADLSDADLSDANLSNADLSDADLRRANLSCANLSGANLNDCIYNLQCPEEGVFIGFKKCERGVIVKLKILEDSKRSSATSRKCRCDKALVVDIDNGLDYVSSQRDSSFIYKKGEIVNVNDFDDNRFNECSTGIHFFITRQEAEKY